MSSPKRHKLLLLGTIVAYCLIGVEIVIMISPFALYFYSIYGPVLDSLSASPLTSWTTEFFLPHMVFTSDLLINAISYLQVLLVIGLVLFFSAALPLYYGRFTGHGVVKFSFYSKIRHPQYLFLAISGFGLLLYWPRFIILVMYITMLFVYYALARNEEWRMKQEAGESYERYMAQTPMFLPGEPGAKLYQLLFGWIKPKWLGILATYLVTLAMAVMLAYGLRSYTVRQLPVVTISQSFTLAPVFERPVAEVREVYEAISQEPEVVAALADKGGSNLAYLMPGDFFLTAVVTDEERRYSDEMIERFPEILEWNKRKFSGGLAKFLRIFYNFVKQLGKVEEDYDIERFVFFQVRDRQGQLVTDLELFAMGHQRLPVLLVDVDADFHEILSVVTLSNNHKWGKMPMPTF